jgi:predicted nucleotidyltransferase
VIDSNKINEITTRIASRFNPDRIILFGSYANGTQKEGSDLDLLIIQETDLPPHKRGFDIRMSLLGLMIPFDILIYTKSEFEREKENKYSFVSSAIKNSKVLYERAD